MHVLHQRPCERLSCLNNLLMFLWMSRTRTFRHHETGCFPKVVGIALFTNPNRTVSFRAGRRLFLVKPHHIPVRSALEILEVV